MTFSARILDFGRSRPAHGGQGFPIFGTSLILCGLIFVSIFIEAASARSPVLDQGIRPGTVALMLWQPSPSHLNFVLPLRAGETPRQAVNSYLQSVRANPLIESEGPGPDFLAEAPEAGWKVQAWNPHLSYSALIVANRQSDHLAHSLRMEELKRPFLIRDIPIMVLPVGAALRLNRYERKQFHRQIARSIPGLNPNGGADLAPQIYRRVPTLSLNFNVLRDRLEIQLIRDYITENLGFVLGICRGAQLINVAFGGKMVQDISAQLNSPLMHGLGENGQSAGHSVRLLPTVNNVLAGLLKYSNLSLAKNIKVNTYHHQAMQVRAGGPVRVAAVSEDGVVEAIEIGSNVLGLQSHPERPEQPGETSFGDAVYDHVADRIRALRAVPGTCESLVRHSQVGAVLGPQAAFE